MTTPQYGTEHKNKIMCAYRIMETLWRKQRKHGQKYMISWKNE